MDTYYTIAQMAEAQHSEMRSKFIAYAVPVETEEEALAEVARLRQEYYDARHVCWAYRLGPNGERYRANDDGEPSGTAGKPILGQLLSLELTNVIVLVIRYFGGVKLGTSGLIEAYREAANLALSTAERKACIIEERFRVTFGYDLMGEVMRYIKDCGARITLQDFREHCALELSIRANDAPRLTEHLGRLYGVTLESLEDVD